MVKILYLSKNSFYRFFISIINYFFPFCGNQSSQLKTKTFMNPRLMHFRFQKSPVRIGNIGLQWLWVVELGAICSMARDTD